MTTTEKYVNNEDTGSILPTENVSFTVCSIKVKVTKKGKFRLYPKGPKAQSKLKSAYREFNTKQELLNFLAKLSAVEIWKVRESHKGKSEVYYLYDNQAKKPLSWRESVFGRDSKLERINSRDALHSFLQSKHDCAAITTKPVGLTKHFTIRKPRVTKPESKTVKKIKTGVLLWLMSSFKGVGASNYFNEGVLHQISDSDGGQHITPDIALTNDYINYAWSGTGFEHLSQTLSRYVVVLKQATYNHSSGNAEVMLGQSLSGNIKPSVVAQNTQANVLALGWQNSILSKTSRVGIFPGVLELNFFGNGLDMYFETSLFSIQDNVYGSCYSSNFGSVVANLAPRCTVSYKGNYFHYGGAASGFFEARNIATQFTNSDTLWMLLQVRLSLPSNPFSIMTRRITVTLTENSVAYLPVTDYSMLSEPSPHDQTHPNIIDITNTTTAFLPPATSYLGAWLSNGALEIRGWRYDDVNGTTLGTQQTIATDLIADSAPTLALIQASHIVPFITVTFTQIDPEDNGKQRVVTLEIDLPQFFPQNFTVRPDITIVAEGLTGKPGHAVSLYSEERQELITAFDNEISGTESDIHSEVRRLKSETELAPPVTTTEPNDSQASSTQQPQTTPNSQQSNSGSSGNTNPDTTLTTTNPTLGQNPTGGQPPQKTSGNEDGSAAPYIVGGIVAYCFLLFSSLGAGYLALRRNHKRVDSNPEEGRRLKETSSESKSGSGEGSPKSNTPNGSRENSGFGTNVLGMLGSGDEGVYNPLTGTTSSRALNSLPGGANELNHSGQHEFSTVEASQYSTQPQLRKPGQYQFGQVKKTSQAQLLSDSGNGIYSAPIRKNEGEKKASEVANSIYGGPPTDPNKDKNVQSTGETYGPPPGNPSSATGWKKTASGYDVAPKSSEESASMAQHLAEFGITQSAPPFGGVAHNTQNLEEAGGTYGNLQNVPGNRKSKSIYGQAKGGANDGNIEQPHGIYDVVNVEQQSNNTYAVPEQKMKAEQYAVPEQKQQVEQYESVTNAL